jgi:hypothetical protein
MVYLQITLKIAPANRSEAAGVYQRYKAPFLDTIPGAKSKELLVRDEDVQVLHGFETAEQALRANRSPAMSSARSSRCSTPSRTFESIKWRN